MFSWCWSWSSSTLPMWWEQMTRWKSPWCWERLRAEGKEGDRGWDGWMVSPIQWIWTWANSGRWGGTGKPGVLQSTELWRVRHNLATEQQQKDIYIYFFFLNINELQYFFQNVCAIYVELINLFFLKRLLDLSYSQKAFLAWRL